MVQVYIKKTREQGITSTNITIEGNMAATAVHETHHATNNDDIKLRKNSRV